MPTLWVLEGGYMVTIRKALKKSKTAAKTAANKVLDTQLSSVGKTVGKILLLIGIALLLLSIRW